MTAPDRDDPQRLALLAVRVIDAAPEDRAALIEEATRDRPELGAALRRVVEESAAAAGPDPLQDLAGVFRLAAVDAEARDRFDMSGRTIDGYVLRRRLGAGAYGAVYFADPPDPDAAPVAFKVLHPGVGSPRVIRRFGRERSVLEALDHPGVARLVDAGTAPDGRPYLVMDLVDGPDLLRWCRRERAPLADRVRLFAAACDAIQHAHGRGVVHRDLKPANILVRAEDGAPQPVVIDFGVARLLDSDGEPSLTALGQPVGTRRFMSPEQQAGEWADVRSDVFSLGVTLREVLEGVPDEEVVAAPAPRVPRELRWIIDQCTERDPQRRYATVSELAADLRRYLEGRPVSASPPNALYQATKLARRRPRTTAAALAALAAIVAFAVLAGSANRRLHRQIDAQRQLIAATLDNVLEEVWVLTSANDVRASLIDELSRRTDELLAEAPDNPQLLLLRGRLLTQQGNLLVDLASYAAAADVRRRALAIFERLRAEGRADVEFRRHHAEAVVKLGDCLGARDGRAEAEPLYRRALAMQHEALRFFPRHIGLRDDICWSYDRLGLFGSSEERLELLERRLALAEQLVEEDRRRSLSLFNLATAHMRCAEVALASKHATDFAEALAHNDEAHDLADVVAAEEPDRAAYRAIQVQVHLQRARLFQRAGDLAAAEEEAVTAQALVEMAVPRQHGRSSLDTLALHSLATLTRLYQRFERPDLAEQCATRLDEHVRRFLTHGGTMRPATEQRVKTALAVLAP